MAYNLAAVSPFGDFIRAPRTLGLVRVSVVGFR